MIEKKDPIHEIEKRTQQVVRLYQEGRCVEAVDLAQRVAELAQSQLDEPSAIASLNNLGAVLQRQGESARAEACYRQALEMRQRLDPAERYPQGHPHLVTSLNNLATVVAQAPGKRRFLPASGVVPPRFTLAPHVHPAPVSPRTPERIVLWVKGPREGGFQRWRWIGPPGQTWKAEGVWVTPVTVRELRQAISNPLLRLARGCLPFLRRREQETAPVPLPTGGWAEALGLPRHDAALVWVEAGSQPLDAATVAEFWDEVESCEQMGPHLFLVLGVRVDASTQPAEAGSSPSTLPRDP
jgi:hypothetical protein